MSLKPQRDIDLAHGASVPKMVSDLNDRSTHRTCHAPSAFN